MFGYLCVIGFAFVTKKQIICYIALLIYKRQM